MHHLEHIYSDKFHVRREGESYPGPPTFGGPAIDRNIFAIRLTAELII